MRLLLALALLAAGLFGLRRFLDDPFYRGVLLPVAFGVVLLAGVLTVRAARVRGGAAANRRQREERRAGDRRGE